MQQLFQQYFNSDQLAGFLSWQDGGVGAQYAAQRLLQLYPNIAMGDIVRKVADGSQLTSFEQQYISTMSRIYQREDAFFSTFCCW